MYVGFHTDLLKDYELKMEFVFNCFLHFVIQIYMSLNSLVCGSSVLLQMCLSSIDKR